MANQSSDVTGLFDEQAIRSLAAAYSYAVMQRDGKAAAATYAVEGELTAFEGPAIVGREAIAKTLCNILEPLAFIVQSCTAGIIDVSGDQARASWSVSEWYSHAAREGLGCCFGVYEDVLSRQQNGWRFQHRIFKPFYRGTLPAQGKLYPDLNR